MLDLRQLKCFVTVADELSFGAAAARLNVVQPALTRTIKRFEERISAKLFDRDTRNVRLTAVGKALVVEARALLEHVERTEQIMRDTARGRTGQLKIAYMDFVTHGYLAAILKQFNGIRPDVRIELFGLPSADQRQIILEGKIDIAFMLGPFAAPGISTRLLREEEMVVVMPNGHALARRKHLEPHDLQHERLIMGSQASWSMYRRSIFTEFDRAGISPVIAQEAPTSSAIFSLVSAGMGITIFPEEACRSYRGDLVVRPFRMRYGSVTTICAWVKASDNVEIKPFLECVPPPDVGTS